MKSIFAEQGTLATNFKSHEPPEKATESPKSGNEPK